MANPINNATSLPTNPVQTTSGQQVADSEVAANQVTKDVSVEGAAPAQPEKRELEVAVSNINDYVQNMQRSIHFSVSESTGRTVIEVYDSETDELIRSIPSEDVQRISEAIAEQLSEGLLIKTSS